MLRLKVRLKYWHTDTEVYRSDADGSLVRWIMVQGQLEEANGGIVIMSHPDNQNHPEAVRVWPDGEFFMTMFPTRYDDWVLEPGKSYELKYRMIVFDGKMTVEEAESRWFEYN